MMVVLIQGDQEIVDLLLQAHADPNLTGEHSAMTALHTAATYGHKAVVQLLLQANADPDLVSPWKTMQAARDYEHEEIVQLLLQSARVTELQ
uniref:Copper amine oxidase-like protein n=1 Tax=Mycena chlorophos TaxID=658473 RepID=A0ABQ0LLL7_MYCCL|nr:copper amine oxidase-like protein [Mycena chlorophos]